jgi:ABC-2 type transport system ATP-binding protein
VAAVCGRVIIVNRGKVALDKALSELGGGNRLRLVTNGKPDAVEAILSRLKVLSGIETLSADGKASTYLLGLDGISADETAAQVARAIHINGLELFALYPETHDLETVFAEITAGAEAREVANA